MHSQQSRKTKNQGHLNRAICYLSLLADQTITFPAHPPPSLFTCLGGDNIRQVGLLHYLWVKCNWICPDSPFKSVCLHSSIQHPMGKSTGTVIKRSDKASSSTEQRLRLLLTVPKRDSGLRSILDLRDLNKFKIYRWYPSLASSPFSNHDPSSTSTVSQP